MSEHRRFKIRDQTSTQASASISKQVDAEAELEQSKTMKEIHVQKHGSRN